MFSAVRVAVNNKAEKRVTEVVIVPEIEGIRQEPITGVSLDLKQHLNLQSIKEHQ